MVSERCRERAPLQKFKNFILRVLVLSSCLVTTANAAPPTFEQLLNGTATFNTANELSEEMRLPAILVSIAKQLVGLTKGEQIEYSTCWKADSQSSANWWVGVPMAGGKTEAAGKDTGGCPSGITGVIHTHPSKALPTPSDLDVATFLILAKAPVWLVAHDSGICAMIRGRDSLRLTLELGIDNRDHARIRLGRYGLASRSRDRNEGWAAKVKLEYEGIAAAMNSMGLALYCGGLDGNLKKVALGPEPEAALDVLAAKALVAMTNASSNHPHLPLTFSFTPEIDAAFLGYLRSLPNAGLSSIKANVSAEKLLVTVALSALNANSAYFGTQVSVPDPRFALGPSTMLQCDSSTNQGVGCVISVDGKGLVIGFYYKSKSTLLDFVNFVPSSNPASGIYEDEDHIVAGSFKGTSLHGDGVITFKSSGRKRRGVFEDGVFVRFNEN